MKLNSDQRWDPVRVNNAAITGVIMASDAVRGSAIKGFISSEWAKEVFLDNERLTEERLDEVLNKFLRDFNEGDEESLDLEPMGVAFSIFCTHIIKSSPQCLHKNTS
ncbi:hypothetical protein Vadar_010805 [Vaccinium darrowii]|uniref:Uncharacterized protein n=1 Tax=Vaccinium darrowii TaxID=229202 RepID=A0ACB7ZAA9_9ERIC|nr:hypothetical protein Vadar_010805 [Vaccinium darrowii]